MLDSLKFVQGGVAKKDLIPEMTHFTIKGGAVKSYNGLVALSSPIELDLECNPKAETLIRAIDSCEETVALRLIDNHKLSVTSGAFRALVECTEKAVPEVNPEGDVVSVDGAQLLEAFSVLLPFVSNDASRPWSNGIFVRNGSAFATNNVILVERWLGLALPHQINIPAQAIRELLRIKEAPHSVQVTQGSATFHFSSGRWLRTQLFSTDWPDIERIIEVSNPQPLPLHPQLFDAVRKIKPFANKSNIVYFNEGSISTHRNVEEGAIHRLDGFTAHGAYRFEMLQLLEGVATSVDWSNAPSPCPFYGNMIRGVIVGMKP